VGPITRAARVTRCVRPVQRITRAHAVRKWDVTSDSATTPSPDLDRPLERNALRKLHLSEV